MQELRRPTTIVRYTTLHVMSLTDHSPHPPHRDAIVGWIWQMAQQVLSELVHFDLLLGETPSKISYSALLTLGILPLSALDSQNLALALLWPYGLLAYPSLGFPPP